jgi:iron(II)-dependent oxidoreductase
MANQDRITLLLENLREARQRTLQLVADLDDIQMVGPRLAIVNPLRWEIGHVAWFEEYWLLRHVCGRPPILPDGDAMYDSAKVAHDTRWDLKLPSKMDTEAFMTRVLDDVSEQFQANALVTPERQKTAEYFLSLALFHEDMHDEAITYSRQTLKYPPPQLPAIDETAVRGVHNGVQIENRDVFIPDGSFELGNTTSEGFVFDNEQQPFIVIVQPFRMSRTATTNAEYSAFVDDNGYQREELWSLEGWEWRKSSGAEHPVYWTFDGASWWRRNFDGLVPLEPNLPVLHVNWYEADAYCRWAGRRLPTEAEWEMAASAEPGSGLKRRFPWGNDAPTPHRANLDSRAMGCIDVNALPDGDSAYGCRQMIGNTWEWTSNDFVPYPDFVAGPYKEYSAPWFGNHKVLRGGCWVTRSRLIHNTYRNFYTPDRCDVWAGFRTCSLTSD